MAQYCTAPVKYFTPVSHLRFKFRILFGISETLGHDSKLLGHKFFHLGFLFIRLSVRTWAALWVGTCGQKRGATYKLQFSAKHESSSLVGRHCQPRDVLCL